MTEDLHPCVLVLTLTLSAELCLDWPLSCGVVTRKGPARSLSAITKDCRTWIFRPSRVPSEHGNVVDHLPVWEKIDFALLYNALNLQVPIARQLVVDSGLGREQ